MKRKFSGHSFGELLFFTAVFLVCLVLAFRLNFADGKPGGAGVFYSDKSIYYVYLPATFIYGWDVNKFPKHCDTLYRGFILNYKTGKIVNKMTCGVAILWTPFFLVTHAAVTMLDLKPDGFSDPYQKMAVVPPVLFLVLGLFFLKKFLAFYFPRYIVYLCLLFLFIGTNLYYYALAEGLMSHVHSFFLFSLCLFLLKKFVDSGKQSFKLFVAISVVVSLAILVRPSNVIILAWFFLLDATGKKEIADRIRIFFRPKHLGAFLLISFLVFLPQLLYWQYAWGSFLHYSYGGEGFVNWKNPVILPLLFSPFNGLFLYNPMVLFFIAGATWMVVRRKPNGILMLLTFALVSYISGSWHMWFFGGSYGARPFVEYYALLSLGFGFILHGMMQLKNHFTRSLALFVMLLFSYYNLRLIYHNSWYTGSTWSWDEYKSRLDQAGILHFSKNTCTYVNDFENISFEPALVQTNIRYYSRTKSAILDSRYPFCNIYNQDITRILDHAPGRISASLWVSPVTSDSTNAVLIASIEDENHQPWFYKKVLLNRFHTKVGEWSQVTLSFAVPLWLANPGCRVKIYLWNINRKTFFVDDIRIKFE